MKPSAVKDVVIGSSLAALVVLAQRGKKRPEQRISGMFYGRSGMLYFPTCFLLRFVCFPGLFTHVMFRHVLWSLRHVVFSDMFSSSPRLFYWPVYACHVPACFMVAPACFIFRHVFCLVLFLLLACLRMSCCGMFYGRSGMLYLPTCLLHVYLPACFFFPLVSACLIFSHVQQLSSVGLFHFHSHLRPGTCLRLCGRYGRQGHVTCLPTFVVATLYVPACFFCRLLSACLIFLACCIPHTIAARCWSCLWSLREAGPNCA